MDLQQRINLLVRLGNDILADEEQWEMCLKQAEQENSWFIPQFARKALLGIAEQFLQKDILEKWARHYAIDDNINPKIVGIVMAGNIPLVGFHDFLCCLICGHYANIKLSSKDTVLFKCIRAYLCSFEDEINKYIVFRDELKNCDAYIATGSNNTGRYFEYYFGKYPSIIRKNRTSVAILTGEEPDEELEKLSDDIHLYFGLGCRNVTKLFVPEGYDFERLIAASEKYAFFGDHNKFKNNYDYQLSILLLGNVYYMSNESTLLLENNSTFSPIGIVHYESYTNAAEIEKNLNQEEIQTIVGKNHTAFGKAQEPGIFDYADGVDTMQFLFSLQ